VRTILAIAIAMVAACGSDEQPVVEDAPVLGAHGQALIKLGEAPGTATVTLATQDTGSMFLIAIAAALDNFDTEAPTDDKGNSYDQLIPVGGAPPTGGSPGARAYTLFPEFGTAVWVTPPNATGGARHTFAIAHDDELTMFVLELRGGEVVRAVWNQPAAGQALTTQSVAVEQPALLVATWWGDQASGPEPTAQPSLGTIAESARDGTPDHYAEGDIATASVAAGTYSVTWTESPDQGAQLHLIAIRGGGP
jgi:hypothetical protein